MQHVWEHNFKVYGANKVWRQSISVRYIERLSKANIDASFGIVGDSYDNTLTETISGL